MSMAGDLAGMNEGMGGRGGGFNPMSMAGNMMNMGGGGGTKGENRNKGIGAFKRIFTHPVDQATANRRMRHEHVSTCE